jgi:hypothetical protein
MTADLPALREAVAAINSRAATREERIIANALPALLDEVEALRVELDIEKKLHARAAEAHAALLDEVEALKDRWRCADCGAEFPRIKHDYLVHRCSSCVERDAERIENARLREAVGTFERACNQHERELDGTRDTLVRAEADLAAERKQFADEHRRHSDLLGLLSEFYPAEADIRECLTRSRDDLAAAYAVLDTAHRVARGELLQTVEIDRTAWLAWQERVKG